MIIIKIIIIYCANLNERLMKLCTAEMIIKFSLSVNFRHQREVYRYSGGEMHGLHEISLNEYPST